MNDYQKKKYNYIINLKKLVREVREGELETSAFDYNFKQLVANNELARKDFLDIAHFIDKTYSLEKARIHGAGAVAVALAGFGVCCANSEDLRQVLMSGVLGTCLGCVSFMTVEVIQDIKASFKSNALLSLIEATMKDKVNITLAETYFDAYNKNGADWICAKTIVSNALDKEFVEKLENRYASFNSL